MEISMYTTVIDGEESQMYAAAVVIPDGKRTKEFMQDQGYKLVDSAIRTLRKKGKITPVWEEPE